MGWLHGRLNKEWGCGLVAWERTAGGRRVGAWDMGGIGAFFDFSFLCVIFAIIITTTI